MAAVTRRWAILAPVLIVGLYYFWGARAAVEYGHYEFGHNLDGYYDFLGQAFAGGHLYLPVQPSPQLLALPDPYDPRRTTPSVALQDLVLFHGRYYLYFGAAPAVMLFGPWRLLTGHDLPEPFAGFLLCFGGFLFASGALLRVLDLAGARPGRWLLALLVFGLGFGQSVPFLLNCVFVYEIAIAGGYFCLSAAVFCLAHAFAIEGAAVLPRWLAASGLAFGMAVACRPHLVLAGVAAAVGLCIYLARRGRIRAAAAFLVAWMLVGTAIATYNFERFGNPLEFGFRYQLAGPGQNRVDLAPRNVLPGVYYMLLARPEFSRVFPWMRMVFRFPFDSAERHPLPADYFVEPSVGALWLAPFLLAACFVPRPLSKRGAEARTVLWIAAAAALAVLLFLVSTHLATQRYEADFLPLGVFAALAGLALRAVRSLAVRVVLVGLVVWGAVANLALGIAGPYDDLLRYRPAGYVRLARWFSPVTEFRPMLNPALSVQLAAAFIPEPPGFREPLITIGHSHHNAFLYVEHLPGALRLVAQSEDGRAVYECPIRGIARCPSGLPTLHKPGASPPL